MSDIRTITGTMRPSFLVLPPVCVFAATAAALWTAGAVNPLYVLLALVGGLSAHISVNMLNEYSDYRSGLDQQTQRTPFSGGSGTLPANPELVRWALIGGLVTLGITALIGIYFLTVWGLALLPLGLLGLVLLFAYTPWVTRAPILTLIAPGLGFGTLMVMGSYFVLTGHYSWTAFFASLPPFFLVSDLLLLNQFPDVEADRAIGRRHFPVLIGRQKSAVIYVAFLALNYVSIVVGVTAGVLPWPALLALLSLLWAVPAARGVLRNYDDIPNLIPSMGQNVLVNISTPVLLGIGLLVGLLV